uniref:Uncharacterized protein n=1 Tax=Avena sativa TaxID=4498 RepID=A0ACD5YW50_AVESA
MAGLSVLLETHESNSGRPQIISKATLHSPKIPSSSSPWSPAAKTPTAATANATGSFLQRCLLCHKDLAGNNDIYMYRGDKAFCSVECRCRQIFIDEDAGGGSFCTNGASAAARSGRRASATGGGGVSFAY